MATSPEPWLARQLGVLAPDASPALREEYARRAGAAAAYREAAGIIDPQRAVSPDPHLNNPELETMRQATINRAGDTRRSKHHAQPEPRRTRSANPGRRTRPSQRSAEREQPVPAHRAGRSRRAPAIRRRRSPTRRDRRIRCQSPCPADGGRTAAARSRQH